eukprot:1811143-Prymnesium_polylepis.1
MADVYASAVGTTVLQLTEIPPRPRRFDGQLCLFGLRDGANEATVRGVLEKRFGPIKHCELEDKPPIVTFDKHSSALAAKSAGAPELCDGMDTKYNERSYKGRLDGVDALSRVRSDVDEGSAYTGEREDDDGRG